MPAGLNVSGSEARLHREPRAEEAEARSAPPPPPSRAVSTMLTSGMVARRRSASNTTCGVFDAKAPNEAPRARQPFDLARQVVGDLVQAPRADQPDHGA